MAIPIDAALAAASERALVARVTRSNPWWFIAGLLVVGAYLRFSNLGDLGIHSDEDISWITSKLILEKGVPEFPSGLMYMRGLGYLYLAAASVGLVGLSEFAIRLPAVLFGLAMIPLSFVFARRLFGVTVGVLTAALVTFSHWDIEVARYARMYAPFSFFLLLTVLCIWEYRVRSERLAGGILCIALAIVSISLHELGYAIALMFLIPPVLNWEAVRARPAKLVFPLVAFFATSIFFLIWRHIVSAGYSVPFTSNPRATTPNMVNPAFGGTFAEGVRVGPVSVPLSSPDLSLLHALSQAAPLLAVLLAAAVAMGLVPFWRKYRARFRTIDTLLLIAVVALSALQLFNLAILAIMILAASRMEGLRGFRTPPVLLAAAVVVVGVALWLVLALEMNLSPHEASAGGLGAIHRIVRQLLDYPRFSQVWGFAREWPLASVVALVGGLWAFDRAARKTDRDVAAGFLLLIFVVPLLVNGVLDHKYQGFRYNVPFDPYYWCFVALGLCKWGELAPTRFVSRHRWRAGIVVLVALLLLDVNPIRAWMVGHRDYTNTGLPYRLYRVKERRDFKTTTAYVAKHAAAGDVVLAIDAREVYGYLGHLDYWLQSSDLLQAYYDGETLREKYVLTPVITDLSQLQGVLQEARGHKWLIATESTVRKTHGLSAGLKDFILNNQNHVVYVGGDRTTKVYRFE